MMNETQALRIRLSSPEQIRAQSYGEVRKPDTINFRTQKPEPSGLFCERIFGPVKDWCCSCGKYKRERTLGFRCEKCGVEVTRSSVRRERMGHIELAIPVAHPWFARSAPSIIALMLDLSTRELRTLLSYSASIVLEIDDSQRAEVLSRIDPKDEMYTMIAGLATGQLLDEGQYRALSIKYGTAFRAGTGAEAVCERLEDLDLEELARELREQIKMDPQHQKKATKRLQIVSAFLESGIDPTFLILDVLPVLPPELRPLVPLGGGRFASSDVNSLYERVLHHNNRIKQFMANAAPESILNHEKRLLQETVDALFDNARCPRPVIGTRRRPLKSLTDTLKGKEGRFRRNLLGKRVDYSGRSVIVGDVTLQLHQCGLPTKICLELFKPFLIRKLVERNYAPNTRVAKRMIERTHKHHPVVWDALSEVLQGKVVLLNRAPTLHRLSIQAFEVVWMSDSNAIRLHPCVCSAFQQIRQLSGIRGLMASPSGKILPIPVRGNYLEGLNASEIFIAGSAARKGFMDRSLNTARSGYLTRKLVEAGVEVWITRLDCGTNESLLITNEESVAVGLPDMRSRIVGRVLAEALPEVEPGALLDDTTVDRILASGISALRVRSPLTCEASYGICQQCYGADLSTGRIVRLGTAVGIIAGQSVGEPGTQLTMRTFHSGGVANAQGDITQGLPRVEELFDGRVPKNKAVLSEIEGVVSIEKGEVGMQHIHVTSHDFDEERVYDVVVGRQLLVEDGARVTLGQALTTGHPDPQDILRLLGRDATARYLISEVQKIYRGTGVYIADKHIECIVCQMLRYVCVNDPGDTNLLPGEIADRFAYAETNTLVLAQSGTAAFAQPILLGLTKAVLQTRSWIAAASFQDTSRVLMKAAIQGQRDGILGFKERLVLGRRIPMRV